MPPADSPGRLGSVSASELAEYAYCPRAWWYRGHPPPGGPDPASQRQARAGSRFHARTLASERRRDRWGWVAAGVAVLAAAIVGWVLLTGGLLP